MFGGWEINEGSSGQIEITKTKISIFHSWNIEEEHTSKFDLVITVEAPIDARIERLKSRGLLHSEIEKRIASQATPEMRRSVSNIVIDNDGSQEDLLRKVEAIWEDLNASSN